MAHPMIPRRFHNQFERLNPKLIPPPNGIDRWADARMEDDLRELYAEVERKVGDE